MHTPVFGHVPHRLAQRVNGLWFYDCHRLFSDVADGDCLLRVGGVAHGLEDHEKDLGRNIIGLAQHRKQGLPGGGVTAAA